ncbi:MAG: phage tail protein [Bacteroidia bacterium]
MNKKLVIGLAALNLIVVAILLMGATGVLISNNAGSAHNSAALEVRSTSQGFLPPVLTSTQRDNISSPATGLTIYNSTTSAIETYNGSAWQGSGGSSAGSAPAGTVMAYAGSTIPSGWLECNGDDISRTTYSDLFAAIGTAWGYGDQSTTFNIPDMRGVFLRGHNNNKTSVSNDFDPNASTRTALQPGGSTGDNVGTFQGYATARPNTNFVTNTTGNHRHTLLLSDNGYPDGSGDRTNNYYMMDNARGESSYDEYTNYAGNHSHSITSGGDSETRPSNVSVKYIIKY